MPSLLRPSVRQLVALAAAVVACLWARATAIDIAEFSDLEPVLQCSVCKTVVKVIQTEFKKVRDEYSVWSRESEREGARSPCTAARRPPGIHPSIGALTFCSPRVSLCAQGYSKDWGADAKEDHARAALEAGASHKSYEGLAFSGEKGQRTVVHMQDAMNKGGELTSMTSGGEVQSGLTNAGIAYRDNFGDELVSEMAAGSGPMVFDVKKAICKTLTDACSQDMQTGKKRVKAGQKVQESGYTRKRRLGGSGLDWL